MFKWLFSKKKNEESETNINIETTVKTGVVSDSVNEIIPAEKRIKDAYPSKNGGLYPHEILALYYADSFYTKGNSYQQFWWNQYGVKSVDAVLQSLLNKGFITVAPLASSLEKKTIAELKEVLESHELSSKGKKAVLIQRLVDEVSNKELETLFPDRLYMRTEKGEEELKSENYVPYIHHHPIEYLDIWSLNQLVYGSDSLRPYRDAIWNYLNQRSVELFSANDFGLYRNCRHRMAAFLREEGKIKGELDLLAEVVFFDLTGMGNNYNPEYLHIKAAYFFPYAESLATTAPGIIKRIFECQSELGLTDDELRKTLKVRMEKLSAPLQLFETDECVNIVFFERLEDKDSLDKLYKIAEKRFHKRYPNLKDNPFR